MAYKSIVRHVFVYPVLLCTVTLVVGCVVIPIGDLLRGFPLEEVVLQEGAGLFSKQKVAIVDIDGTISGKEGGNLMFSQQNSVAEVKRRLQLVQNDPEVLGLVLRISSPGGEVTACDVIHHLILDLKEKKGIPVVAAIVDTGASGAYYIATAADTIYAHPTAVVGNIGVLLQSFNVSGLIDKIGVSMTTVKSADFKDLASPFRKPQETELEVLQTVIDRLHENFVDAVDEGRRDLTREQVEKLADGKVYVASDALNAGLVDNVGYLEEAIENAAEQAGVDSPTLVRYARASRSAGTIYSAQPPWGVESQSDSEFSLKMDAHTLPRTRFLYLWTP